jgi:hypothetical protein
MEKSKRTRRAVTFKLGLILLSSPFAFAFLLWVGQSLNTPYKKDLHSGYLLAKAMSHGVDPYVPLADLVKRWLPERATGEFVHPTPHPFAVGWLCLPLSALNYTQAAVVWLVFEIICLLIALLLWQRLMGYPKTLLDWALGLTLLCAWYPLALELWFAQLSICLLPLFLAAWLALRKGRELTGGLYLGALVVLKLMGWPILLWLAWQRRWRAVAAAAAFWLGAHGLAVSLHGWVMVRDYYLKVGPLVGFLYRNHDANLSLWTVGQRLFGEMHWYFVSVPLWHAPKLASALAVLVPVGVLGWLVFCAARARQFDTSFALLMGGGLFLTPVTWEHYFVMALPALALLFQRLAARHWPRWQTGCAVLLLGAASMPHVAYVPLLKPFAVGTTAGGLLIVPALPALLTMLPVAALGCLLWQMVRLEAPVAAVHTAEQGGFQMHERTVLEAAPSTAPAGSPAGF